MDKDVTFGGCAGKRIVPVRSVRCISDGCVSVSLVTGRLLTLVRRRHDVSLLFFGACFGGGWVGGEWVQTSQNRTTLSTDISDDDQSDKH